jgi:hypothetical protein
MLNYLKKFAVDIFPSVAATVIGAYIVNHYIVARPTTDTPPAAAASTANPKDDGKAEAKSESKPAETTASVSNLPAAGVKAKGISEKAVMEKTAAEKSAAVEKAHGKSEAKNEAKNEAKADERAEAKADTKTVDIKTVDAKAVDTKSADAKPAEPKSAEPKSAEPKSEKIRIILPSPIQAVQSAAAPASAAVPAAPATVAAPVEAAAVVPATVAPEEHRDANDLARAAIERLRASEVSPRTEPARAHETPKEISKEMSKAANAPVVTHAPAAASAPALRPLPPPIMVSGPPANEPFGQAPSPPRPPYAEAANPNRPIPPADIPLSRPLDLRADMAEPSVRDRATAAAEDALSTAKSIFHAVLPK